MANITKEQAERLVEVGAAVLVGGKCKMQKTAAGPGGAFVAGRVYEIKSAGAVKPEFQGETAARKLSGESATKPKSGARKQ